MDYSEGIESPRLFRKWAAIGAVGAALQRRTYTLTRTGPIYPNDFILLVARPGVGKTVAIDLAQHFLRRLGEKLHILPSSVTKEKMYEEMQKNAVRTVDGTSNVLSMCSAVALPDELGVFIRPKDFEFLQDLIKLYDCIKLFTYATKNAGSNRLENVSLTILGGTQPDTLRKILPPEAFGMGFAARLILIYSSEKRRMSVFDGGKMLDASVDEMLTHDLKEVFNLSGKYVFSTDAVKYIEEWNSNGMKPEPHDRRLESYNTRRVIHMLKLCMVSAASRGDELLITERDAEFARQTMLEAEGEMSLCFQSMGENSSITQVENVYAFIVAEYEKSGKKGVEEWKIRDMLLREMPIYAIKTAFQEMHGAGWVTYTGDTEGMRLVFPARRASVH